MAFSKLKEVYTPQSSEEVVKLLKQHGHGALILGGGTFLHGLSARGLLPDVEALIDIQKLGLDYFTPSNGVVKTGASVTFTALEKQPELTKAPWLGVLKDALEYIPVQVKNMATVGGSLASSLPLFDLPVAFMTLKGSVVAAGPKGNRKISLDEFFKGQFENALQRGEFITEVLLPVPPRRTASAFLKNEKHANALAILNVGVSITLDKAGKCEEARVVFGGGVGDVPVRGRSCENALEGKRPNKELLKLASETVEADLNPISDHRASAKYRKAIAKVLVERAFETALQKLN
ncbi:MAG: FAD binding domain-containing protein [Acidobacteria bacterium]|nr:FAD binding domain-containing protein [Acidobacteriota bacterium]